MIYIPRYTESTLNALSQTFKVVYIGGPRQVGKTTMLRHLAANQAMGYATLDDSNTRRLAQRDPALFLQQFPGPALIDEVQYAPELFSALKVRVDTNPSNGQFWLTGSQHFSMLRNMQESLAGRVGIAHMLGFSLAELQQRPRAHQPFVPTSQSTVGDHPVTMPEVYAHIWRGGYPALWQPEAPRPDAFYNSYVQTYIDRDLVNLFGITKVSEFHTFLQLCAARTGQMLNYSDLARDAGVSIHAAREWLSILEQTSIVYLLRPYHTNVSKRLVKTPKLYLLDTGLAAHLTQWPSPETLQAGAMAGPFLETFVVSEIIKSYLCRGLTANLYYWRDKERHEIDLLLAHERQLYPIEIKRAATINPEDGVAMAYVRNKIPTLAPGTVLSLSPGSYALDRSTQVRPVTMIS